MDKNPTNELIRYAYFKFENILRKVEESDSLDSELQADIVNQLKELKDRCENCQEKMIQRYNFKIRNSGMTKNKDCAVMCPSCGKLFHIYDYKSSEDDGLTLVGRYISIDDRLLKYVSFVKDVPGKLLDFKFNCPHCDVELQTRIRIFNGDDFVLMILVETNGVHNIDL
mgnify:FL=1